MTLKFFFQIILILIIITIISIFYYNFFLKNKENVDLISKSELETISKIDENVSNELSNIEYNAFDENGNTYYIYAKKAIVKSNEKDDENNVLLEDVISIITIKNKGLINIFSNYADYNRINNNTFFYGDVKIEYLDNLITSQNLDVIFTKKISKIYNNVNYKNEIINLSTDNILIDTKTGDIKLEMDDINEKVRLVSKYNYAN